MNIKKQLKSLSITSILLTGFILAPTSAMAERHHSDNKYQNNHSKHQGSQRGSHKNRHHDGRRYYGHRHHRHNHRRDYSVNYYRPIYIEREYWDDGFFTFGYQNDHFGFTIRD